MTPTIYHNPACGTSRNVLAILEASGVTPRVVHYLDTPLDDAGLRGLLEQTGLAPHELLRTKEPLCAELGLNQATVDNEAIIAAMQAHPILMNRPVVVSEHGAALCRPAERVFDLITHPVAVFTKEDGDIVSSR